MQRLFIGLKSIKSFLFAPAIFIASFILVSCGAVKSENQATDANQVLPNETNSAPAASAPTPEINTDWEQYLSSNVVEYSVSTKECDYSDGSLEIQVEFKNLTDKTIIAFEANAIFLLIKELVRRKQSRQVLQEILASKLTVTVILNASWKWKILIKHLS